MPLFHVNYGPLGRALVRAFNIPPEHVGRINSRIKNLRRGGLLGTVPIDEAGDSKFTPKEIHKLIIALALGHAGLRPTEILALINDDWDRIDDGIRKANWDAGLGVPARRTSDEVYMLVFNINLLVPEGAPHIEFKTGRELRDVISLADPSAIAINLSKTLHRFYEAFNVEHDLTEKVARELMLKPDPLLKKPKRK